MKKKTYSEKTKDLCDNFWNDYQETTDIEYVLIKKTLNMLIKS